MECQFFATEVRVLEFLLASFGLSACEFWIFLLASFSFLASEFFISRKRVLQPLFGSDGNKMRELYQSRSQGLFYCPYSSFPAEKW